MDGSKLEFGWWACLQGPKVEHNSCWVEDEWARQCKHARCRARLADIAWNSVQFCRCQPHRQSITRDITMSITNATHMWRKILWKALNWSNMWHYKALPHLQARRGQHQPQLQGLAWMHAPESRSAHSSIFFPTVARSAKLPAELNTEKFSRIFWTLGLKFSAGLL